MSITLTATQTSVDKAYFPLNQLVSNILGRLQIFGSRAGICTAEDGYAFKPC